MNDAIRAEHSVLDTQGMAEELNVLASYETVLNALPGAVCLKRNLKLEKCERGGH